MILVTAAGAVADDIIDLDATVGDLGARTLLIDNSGGPRAPATVPYPAMPEWLSPIGAIVAGQLIVHRLTLMRGLDPDNPRTITKITRTR